MTTLRKTVIILLAVVMVVAALLFYFSSGDVGGYSDEELPYNTTASRVSIGPDDFKLSHDSKQTFNRTTGCHHRRYTMWLRMVGTDRLYWRFWQDTYWCTGYGSAPRSHRFTADHWQNSAPDNLWDFKQMYDPVRHWEWWGKPRRKMYESVARGKFQWCVTRFGCIRTIEPWVKSQVVPNVPQDGYYHAKGGA